MFTSFDKALVALILGVLSIVTTVWGVDWFDHVTEDAIAVIVGVLMPLLVWLIPNARGR